MLLLLTESQISYICSHQEGIVVEFCHHRRAQQCTYGWEIVEMERLVSCSSIKESIIRIKSMLIKSANRIRAQKERFASLDYTIKSTEQKNFESTSLIHKMSLIELAVSCFSLFNSFQFVYLDTSKTYMLR
jgi:acyl CoA:acetate/3-ketoacid CoA transferase